MSRYTGTCGIIESCRGPAEIAVIQGGRLEQAGRRNGLFSFGKIRVGNYTNDHALFFWDTGATESVLFLPDPQKAIQKDPYDTGMIRLADGSLTDVAYHENARLEFAGAMSFHMDLIDVMDAKPDLCDVLIGMDIITKGTFCYDGRTGNFSFELI